MLRVPAESFAMFFFNDTPPTEIYILSLHDALPISVEARAGEARRDALGIEEQLPDVIGGGAHRDLLFDLQGARSEEHTSELQSQFHLVCRLLLEKKKINKNQRERTSSKNGNLSS